MRGMRLHHNYLLKYAGLNDVLEKTIRSWLCVLEKIELGLSVEF